MAERVNMKKYSRSIEGAKDNSSFYSRISRNYSVECFFHKNGNLFEIIIKD